MRLIRSTANKDVYCHYDLLLLSVFADAPRNDSRSATGTAHISFDPVNAALAVKFVAARRFTISRLVSLLADATNRVFFGQVDQVFERARCGAGRT